MEYVVSISELTKVTYRSIFGNNAASACLSSSYLDRRCKPDTQSLEVVCLRRNNSRVRR